MQVIQLCSLFTRSHAHALQVVWGNVKYFHGSTPSAPLNKLALYIGDPLAHDGMQASHSSARDKRRGSCEFSGLKQANVTMSRGSRHSDVAQHTRDV